MTRATDVVWTLYTDAIIGRRPGPVFLANDIHGGVAVWKRVPVVALISAIQAKKANSREELNVRLKGTLTTKVLILCLMKGNSIGS